MKRTEFITLAMKDLLVLSGDYHNLFPNGLESCDKGEKSFFDLQTFPHIGDIVVGSYPVPILFKVQSIRANNNEVMIASKFEVHYPITRIYPICITNDILIKLGFKWDDRFSKFRLRLKGFHNIDIEKTNYPELEYYIRGIGNIKYLHELQAVLRIYGIDTGILINILRVGMGLNRKD